MCTTISDKASPFALDHVNRQFHAPAPEQPWLSDFTYVATWAGFVYVASCLVIFWRTELAVSVAPGAPWL